MPTSGIPVLKRHDWHPADRAAWEAATSAGKPPFVRPGSAYRWSHGTRDVTEQAIGQFLGWSISRGGPRRFVDAYEVNAVRDYLVALGRTAARATLYTRLEGIGRGFLAIAGNYPKRDLTRLRAFIEAAELGRPPKRTDTPLTDDLLDLGRRLIREVGRVDPATNSIGDLIQFRDGLFIAFLATHPLRIGVFTDLTLGRDLTLEPERVRVRIAATRQKNRRSTTGDLKDELFEPFQHYLHTVRPALLARGNVPLETDRLWITRRGTAFEIPTGEQMVRRRTRAGLGREIGPHKFRHAAATYVAIKVPHMIAIVSGVLSHRDIRTAQKHYNLAKSTEAQRRWDRVVRGIERGER
jgi:integrase/recombinase XerD